jgi:L-lactate dehydrogenase complex protein LldF
VDVAETDLGEYIIQLSGERPYHITGPALHKRLPEIRALFSEAAGEPLPEGVDSLAAFARTALRDKFLTADVGISGANLGIASTGTVVLVTNEGNGRMTTTLPGTHIVVMGIERLVPDWPSLGPVLTMLTRAGTGERTTAYVSAITGPRRGRDVDGPDELHVVLVDNGRSRLLGTKYQDALTCIRCGSCADFCPVYRTMGGHAYEATYTGPIGAVVTPLLEGLDGHEHLPFASTLCGACDAACPARVPLTDLLLELRADVVERQGSRSPWAVAFKGFARLSERPRLWAAFLTAVSAAWPVVARLRRAPLGLLAAWTGSRDLPTVARRGFRRSWAGRPGDRIGRSGKRGP